MKLLKKKKRVPPAPKAVAQDGLPVIGDVDRAYAIVRSVAPGNLYHLLILEIKNDRVISCQKGIEDLRDILLAKMQADLLRDA